MEIEDIINKVRFTNSEHKNARQRSTRESRETSIISEARSAPESVACLETSSSGDYAKYESDVSRTASFRRQRQEKVDAEVRQKSYSPPRRRRARTTSDTQDSQHLPKQWPLKQPQQSMGLPYGHVMPPMDFPAYLVVPMHIPLVNHFAPHPASFSITHRPHYRPQQPHRTHKEEKPFPKPPQRGVRLPPLPESLRRAQSTSKRKPVQPKEKKKKRIRAPPVVHEYDHFTVEEAIQELARRNIHITDMQQVDISKTNLVKLLQRADRNNNRGSGNPKDAERMTSPA